MTPEDHQEALLEFAKGALLRVLARGRDTHKPGEWLQQKVQTHISHALEHGDMVENIRFYDTKGDKWLEDAENCLCRWAMALYRHEQGRPID